MSVYCITSQHGVGCTFFDWTIHFLSGQENFYQADQRQWIPLSKDPVLEINAHGHLKNHPGGISRIVEQLKNFLSMPQDQLYSLYPTGTRPEHIAKLLGIPIDKIGTQENWHQITQYIHNDYCQLFEHCYQQDIKLIYVDNHPNVNLYFMNTRFLDKGLLTNTPLASQAAVTAEQQQIFFNNSINVWNNLELTNVWDLRERMALDTRPFHSNNQEIRNMQYPHLWVNCQELWLRGERVALTMLKFLELELQEERLLAWRPIYAKWQEMQLQRLEFNLTYQHIVDSIINNWYYEIDLTFNEEVVIQHCLIYQHNLSLKNWQLEKFPNNTQDLHKLLEPNIHPL
jgi:hypothetical protein